jgi:hypothetical protein
MAGNKGNDDAPTNKVYMRYADAYFGKRLMKLRPASAQSLTA